MCGIARSGVFESLCDENKSGGFGKSSKELSESTADEEGGEKHGFWSKCCGFGDGEGSRKALAWSCATGAAGTQEEGGARCAAAGPRR